MPDNKEFNAKIGSTIAKARESFNWTQEQLADFISKPVNAIKGMEEGRISPTIQEIVDIAEALGFTLNEMVSGDISKGPFGGNKEFAELFYDTTPNERRILYDVGLAAIKSIKDNRPANEKP